MIANASIVQVKEWMGHADVDTTMQYLHYSPRASDAALVAAALSVESGQSTPGAFSETT